MERRDERTRKHEFGLARAAQEGDGAAFNELVSRLEAGIRSYVHTRVGNMQAVDDLTQETIVGVWIGLPRFRSGSSVRTWAFAIANHRIGDHLRRRDPLDYPVRDSVGALECIASGWSQPLDVVLFVETLEALVEVLERLPRVSREVWWLCEIEGVTVKQVAAELGISEGAARGRRCRAQEYVRTHMRESGTSAARGLAIP